MIVRYLDLATGRRAEDRGITPRSLMDGNWNCDCNRGIPFDGPRKFLVQNEKCLGHERFIVHDVEKEDGDEPFDTDEVIKEANERYYERLCAVLRVP